MQGGEEEVVLWTKRVVKIALLTWISWILLPLWAYAATGPQDSLANLPITQVSSSSYGGLNQVSSSSQPFLPPSLVSDVPVQHAVQQTADEQLDQLPVKSIDSFWQHLRQQYGGYLPDDKGQGLVRDVLNQGGFNFQGIFHGLLRYFFSVLMDNTQLIGSILVLSVLAAILRSLETAFEHQTVSQVAYAVVFIVLLGLALASFTEAAGYARHAIQGMTDFMLASLPLMVTLLAASGAVTSAAFFQPTLVFTVELIGNLVFLFVFPMIYFATLLDIVSNLSPRYSLTRLAGLFRTVAVSTLGVALTVFLGVASIQGLGRGVVDGVALRAAKFSLGTFVPVVGKAIADATETVISASLLVKNAVGIAGLIILAIIAVFPALKVLALTFIYSGSAALMQPLGDNPMISVLGSLSKSLMLIFASLAAVAMMFFLSVTILIATANLAVMFA